jgi:hypothetical protein
MGNTASQLEQQASKQENLEKQLSALTVNINKIDKLVTGLKETHSRAQHTVSTIKAMQENELDEFTDITTPLLDPTIIMFERELTPADREEFISKVIAYLTMNSAAIVENKDNQYGKSIAEIVNKIGFSLSNSEQEILPYL